MSSMACAGPAGTGVLPFAVQCRDGSFVKNGGDSPDFTLVVKTPRQFEWFLNADIYSAAVGFIRGDFDIQGDIVSAVAFKTEQRHPAVKDLLTSALARFSPGRIESWFQTKARAAENIRFHYDRSNDFYRQFLDPRMLYSSADFSDPEESLENAQLANSITSVRNWKFSRARASSMSAAAGARWSYKRRRSMARPPPVAH